MKIGNVALAVIIWMIGGMIAIFFGAPSIVSGDGGTGCFLMFVIGLIAFIIGIIVILKGREIQPQLQSQPSTPPVKPNRYCPKCGREIPFDAVFCPYCQYDFK